MAQALLPFAQPAALLPSAAVRAETALPRAAGQDHRGAAANAADAVEAGSASLDGVGFQIGWDHAAHGLTPPLQHLHSASPVRQGWMAGRAALALRTRRAGAHHRQWLALRLAAWQRGEPVEDLQVTPHFLSRIDAEVCPVSRVALMLGTGAADDATVQRLNPAAAWAAGNLVVTSQAVAQAREAAGSEGGALGVDALAAQAQALAECGDRAATQRGLDARAWQRLAVLASFGTPLPHAQAAGLPLVVLPPNRVRVINPVQALQVALTLQLTQGGYARRLLTLAALMPQGEARQAFQIFMHTLLARRLAAGQPADSQTVRRALEEAWSDPLVQRRWQRLALRLRPADCERLLERAHQRGLLVGAGRWLPTEQALEGWAMPDAAAQARSPHAAQGPASDAQAPVGPAEAALGAGSAGPALGAAEAPTQTRLGLADSAVYSPMRKATARRALATMSRNRGSQKLAN